MCCGASSVRSLIALLEGDAASLYNIPGPALAQPLGTQNEIRIGRVRRAPRAWRCGSKFGGRSVEAANGEGARRRVNGSQLLSLPFNLRCSSNAFSLPNGRAKQSGHPDALPRAPKTLSVNSCRRNPPQDDAREQDHCAAPDVEEDAHGRRKGRCGCAGEALGSVPRRPRAFLDKLNGLTAW